jgi:hypothetical protein
LQRKVPGKFSFTFLDDALKIPRVQMKFDSKKTITDVENVGHLKVV